MEASVGLRAAPRTLSAGGQRLAGKPAWTAELVRCPPACLTTSLPSSTPPNHPLLALGAPTTWLLGACFLYAKRSGSRGASKHPVNARTGAGRGRATPGHPLWSRVQPKPPRLLPGPRPSASSTPRIRGGPWQVKSTRQAKSGIRSNPFTACRGYMTNLIIHCR